ncbi:MAG: type II and III secretion system protein family protein [Desulfovibrionaceae bacterium]
MSTSQIMGRLLAAALAATMAVMLQAATVRAQMRLMASNAPQAVELVKGKSVILRTEIPVRRVSLAAPDYADIVLISPSQLYLTGKAPGRTNLTLWGENDEILAVYDLDVRPDVTRLKELLHQVLPEESAIQVLPTGEGVTLAGSVSSAAHLSTAVALAQSFTTGENSVVNLLAVGGVHQVLLEVRVAEMNRDTFKRLGFNWSIQSGSDLFYTFLGGLSSLDGSGSLTLSDDVTAALSVSGGDTTVDGIIDALRKNGLVKILAEPNLVCLSGQTADFLAGGEIPVPVPQGLGTVAIEYKPFGVGLTFTPTVLAGNRINLKVQPEVSELDDSRAVEISDVTVPAIETRRASTVVELGDGQSFAIAGLIKDNVRENISKIPLLGEIPVLGALFRSQDFQKNRSELVIIVTPHLAKPTNMAEQTLPTDGFKEPDWFEFYLLGMDESRESHAGRPKAASAAEQVPAAADQGGFDGSYGPVIPGEGR